MWRKRAYLFARVVAGLMLGLPLLLFSAHAQTVPPQVDAPSSGDIAAPRYGLARPGEAASMAMARAILTVALVKSNPELMAEVRPAQAPPPSALGNGTSLRDLVARYALEAGIPFRLANAVVMVESHYRPRSAHGGALGLMQIKPETARDIGFSGADSGLYDPDINVKFGMKYLATAYHQSHGDLCRTLMRYQSGLMTSHPSAANDAYCSKARAFMAQL